MTELRLPLRRLAVWFEIPVRDLETAATFYRAALGWRLRAERRAGTTRMVIEDPRFGDGGALVLDARRAGAEGSLIYVHAGTDLAATLERVERAGGSLVQAPLALGDGLGRYAIVRDPDGNPLGLHAPD